MWLGYTLPGRASQFSVMDWEHVLWYSSPTHGVEGGPAQLVFLDSFPGHQGLPHLASVLFGSCHCLQVETCQSDHKSL